MSCKISLERVAQHLTAVETGHRSGLSAHIASCPQCAARVADLTETERIISGIGMTSPPEGMWAKIAPRLEQRQPAGASAPFALLRARAALAAVATVLVAALVIFQHHPQALNQQDPDLQEFYQHYSAVTPAQAESVVTSADLHSFAQASQIAIRLPRNMPPGWRLTGLDRFTCAGGRPVAHLVYTSGERTLSIFEKPLGGGSGMGMGRGRGRGHGRGGGRGRGVCRLNSTNAAFRSGATHKYVVMGDLPAEELQALANDLESQN